MASANLNTGAQLMRGVRVDLEGYMASRHRNGFWVTGGYATLVRSRNRTLAGAGVSGRPRR